jgi:hypothetical protein
MNLCARLLGACACLVLASCASLSSLGTPNASVPNNSQLLVIQDPQDGRQVYDLIADELDSRGYRVSIGNEEKKGEADITVHYWTRWVWDVVPYLTELSIEFRDAKTGELICAADAYRPSLQRISAKSMVRRVITAALEKSARAVRRDDISARAN